MCDTLPACLFRKESQRSYGGAVRVWWWEVGRGGRMVVLWGNPHVGSLFSILVSWAGAVFQRRHFGVFSGGHNPSFQCPMSGEKGES